MPIRFPSARHQIAYDAMLAHAGSYWQRVEAGINALRSEKYRTILAARLVERSFLIHSGATDAVARMQVDLPRTEACRGAGEMRPWLRAAMDETIRDWRMAGETQLFIHSYRDFSGGLSWKSNWLLLVEWEPGAWPMRARWPHRRTPFVIEIHERPKGVLYRKGADWRHEATWQMLEEKSAAIKEELRMYGKRKKVDEQLSLLPGDEEQECP